MFFIFFEPAALPFFIFFLGHVSCLLLFEILMVTAFPLEVEEFCEDKHEHPSFHDLPSATRHLV
jgi:hypothetical protein